MDQTTENLGPQQGNHLLGFKEDKRPSRVGFWLVSLIGLAALGTALVLSGKYLLDSFSFPEGTFAWAVVRNPDVLPPEAPEIWQKATRGSSWPAVVGWAKKDNAVSAFAITHGWTASAGIDRLRIGPFSVASEKTVSGWEKPDASTLGKAALSLLNHQAYIVLKLTGLDPAADIELDGPADGRSWRTNLPLKRTKTVLPTDKTAALDLETWPEAWPAVNVGLKQLLNGTEVSERPAFISWNAAAETTPLEIDLGYGRKPATSTIYNLAGALGLYDESDIALPDGSSLVELRWPIKRLADRDFGRDWPDMTIVGLRQENLVFTQQVKSGQIGRCGNGKPVAFFSQDALRGWLKSDAHIGFPDGLVLLEQDGFLNICF